MSNTAKIIAFINNKGGVCKTTSAVSTAAGLCRMDRQVLLVDMDPQGSACISLGFNPNTLQKTIYESLISGEPAPCYVVREGFYIVPANIRLTLYDTQYQCFDDDHRLNTIINPLKSIFDYIIIDCPPAFSKANRLVLFTADYLIIPLKAETLSLEGLNNMQSFVKEAQRYCPSLKILGILLVLYQFKNRVLFQRIKEKIEESYPGLLFDTVIRDNVRLAEAPGTGLDIFTYDKTSIGAMDYLHFVLEVIERIENNDQGHEE